jgi:outer membrane protein
MMMRQLILSTTLCLLAPAFAESATLTDNNPPRALKIGVIDVRAVVQKSPQLQTINTQLTQRFKPREQAIIEAQAKYKSEEDKLNKDGPILSDTERSKLEHQVINDRANLQAMITAFQQDLDNEQNSAMQKLLSQIASIVNDIATSQHYDLILQGDSVPYVTDQLNITNTVLQKLSNK